MKRASVAVVGANGYVGRALCVAVENRPELELTRVTRADYERCSQREYDFLINAAMPSKRFWAKSNPGQDFLETVQKTAELLYGWKYRKFVQISSVSARCEPQSVYGRHKATAESLCGSDALIVRLSAMFSADLGKGALVDILAGKPVFVDASSRYPFASKTFAVDWVARNLGRTGVVEVGARNAVSLGEIARHLRRDVKFSGPVEDQSLANPDPGYPDANEVLAFMDAQAKTPR